MSHEEHKARAPARVRVGVITVSDTRTEASDESGRAIVDLLKSANHSVLSVGIVRDDVGAIAAATDRALSAGADVVILTGGTGVARRDVTVEALKSRFAKELPGFGELFRRISAHSIGSSAIMSRATAGVTSDNRVLILLPGSLDAVELAMERIVLPELGHLVEEARRG